MNNEYLVMGNGLYTKFSGVSGNGNLLYRTLLQIRSLYARQSSAFLLYHCLMLDNVQNQNET